MVQGLSHTRHPGPILGSNAPSAGQIRFCYIFMLVIFLQNVVKMYWKKCIGKQILQKWIKVIQKDNSKWPPVTNENILSHTKDEYKTINTFKISSQKYPKIAKYIYTKPPQIYTKPKT